MMNKHGFLQERSSAIAVKENLNSEIESEPKPNAISVEDNKSKEPKWSTCRASVQLCLKFVPSCKIGN